jgi:hypothetical protein
MRYDLVEPPVTVILEKLSAVSPSLFTKAGAMRSYGASIDDADGSRIFRILLDSSAEKIRIWFDAARCRMHGHYQQGSRIVPGIPADSGRQRPSISGSVV